MPSSIVPVNEEVCLDDEEFIVSKTDAKGVITYTNRVFMRIAGYREEQLLGQPHSIIRHPDMPRGVFRFMWDEIKRKREFFGYVKNLCADGRYYWVFANISPDFDADERLQGFYSVRRRPTRKALETIIPIYREMLAIEARHSERDACDASIAYLQQQLSDAGVDYETFVLGLANEEQP